MQRFERAGFAFIGIWNGEFEPALAARVNPLLRAEQMSEALARMRRAGPGHNTERS